MSSRTRKSLWHLLAGKSKAAGLPSYRRQLRQHRLGFEPLEDRRLLAVTRWVDPNAIANNTTIFNTIGLAVSTANSGDTIKVVAGTYDESVTVDKTLTIIGGQVHVAGQPAGITRVEPPMGDDFSFLLKANNITIKDFTIEDANDGIETNPSFSGYHITDNAFDGDGIGIRMGTLLTGSVATSTVTGNLFYQNNGASYADVGPGVRNVTISDNLFEFLLSDNAIKVESTGQSINIQILDNKFSDLIPGGDVPGILLTNVTSAKVEGNTMFQGSTSYGIDLSGGVTNSIISGNQLLYPADAAGNGIQLDETEITAPDTGNQITGNTINGYAVGISVDDQTGNTISKNTITNCSTAGIDLFDGSSKDPISSNIMTSCENGILLVDVSANTVSKNSISGNYSSGGGADGIQVSNGSTMNTISSNIAEHVDGSGILVDDAGGNTFTSNINDYDKQDGIKVQNGSTGNTFTGNTADYNLGNAGIEDTAGPNQYSKNNASFNNGNGFEITIAGMVISNVADANVQAGIFIYGGNSATIKSNITNSNGASGLSISDGTGDTITGNTSDNNFGSGLLLSGVTDSLVAISGNVAKDNDDDGIHVFSNSTGNTFTKNTATGNAAIEDATGGGGYDLEDDTSGGMGPGGVNNTWHANHGQTANPVGLLTA